MGDRSRESRHTGSTDDEQREGDHAQLPEVTPPHRRHCCRGEVANDGRREPKEDYRHKHARRDRGLGPRAIVRRTDRARQQRQQKKAQQTIDQNG